MTGTNHGMTGAVIALTVKNPAIAIPLSFASHFAQDILPHWDYGVSRDQNQSGKFFTRRFNIFLAADFLIAVTIMVVLAFIFPSLKWIIWACMIAAASPDLMWAYYRLYLEHHKQQKPKHGWLAKFHIQVQWSQTAAGLITEVAWFILTGIIILSLR
jgi:hypothetical protein